MLEQCYCQSGCYYTAAVIILCYAIVSGCYYTMLEQCYCQRLLLYVRTMLLSAVVIILC